MQSPLWKSLAGRGGGGVGAPRQMLSQSVSIAVCGAYCVCISLSREGEDAVKAMQRILGVILFRGLFHCRLPKRKKRFARHLGIAFCDSVLSSSRVTVGCAALLGDSAALTSVGQAAVPSDDFWIADRQGIKAQTPVARIRLSDKRTDPQAGTAATGNQGPPVGDKPTHQRAWSVPHDDFPRLGSHLSPLNHEGRARRGGQPSPTGISSHCLEIASGQSESDGRAEARGKRQRGIEDAAPDLGLFASD